MLRITRKRKYTYVFVVRQFCVTELTKQKRHKIFKFRILLCTFFYIMFMFFKVRTYICLHYANKNIFVEVNVLDPFLLPT